MVLLVIGRATKTSEKALCELGPFSIEQLFRIVFDTLLDLVHDQPDTNVVTCHGFTSRFLITNDDKVLNETMSFYKVTFQSFTSLHAIYNVTVGKAADGVPLSEAWITCRNVVLTYFPVADSNYFRDETPFIIVTEPRVLVKIKYYLKSRAVELLWARFATLNFARRNHYIPMRENYEKLSKQMADNLFSHFMVFNKQIVDDALQDLFVTAIEMSDIANVLNVTVLPTQPPELRRRR